ncbi:hypothetical protein D3C80_1763950 [compost metagenome]
MRIPQPFTFQPGTLFSDILLPAHKYRFLHFCQLSPHNLFLLFNLLGCPVKQTVLTELIAECAFAD